MRRAFPGGDAAGPEPPRPRSHGGWRWIAAAGLSLGLAISMVWLGPGAARAGPADPLEPTKRPVLSAAEKPPGSPGSLGLPASPPLLVPDEARLRSEKRRAARTAEAGAGAQAGPAISPRSPLAAVSGGLNLAGLSAGTRSPPDSTGAIGPSNYVEMVNSEIGVFGRTNLAALATADLDDFVGAPGDSVFDPQVQWDEQAQRWLYVAVDVVADADNFLAFGWSQTASPTALDGTGWCNFFIDTDDELEDYPKLGHNDNHIILGTNVFDDSLAGSSAFLTARVWAIPKPASGDTTCTAPSAFSFGSPGVPLTTADGDEAFTPVPANAAGSAGDGFIVAADSPTLIGPNRTQIMAWHISGPGGAPVLTQDGNLAVSTFNIPADVPQPGTANTLDSLDARLTQAVSAIDPAVGQQAVWTQHTIAGAGGRSEARWYELLPGSTSVRQEGSISSATDFIFNAAISPTSSGERAAINYNVGSSSLFAELRAQSRDSAAALTQMGAEITLGTSSVADESFTCGLAPVGVCRWGDYAGASPDPNDPTLVWGSNQLNGPQSSDPAWLTRNFALVADGPTAPIVDVTPPVLTVRGSRRQQNFRRVKVRVSANEAVSIEATGRIRVPRVRRSRVASGVETARTRRFNLRRVSTDLAAGETRRLKLRLRGNARKQVRRALRRGKTSRATVNVTATDAVGLTDDGKRKIRVKKRR